MRAALALTLLMLAAPVLAADPNLANAPTASITAPAADPSAPLGPAGAEGPCMPAATPDQVREVLLATPIVVWTDRNMGPGSCLDADRLDGHGAEDFLDAIAAEAAARGAALEAEQDARLAADQAEADARAAADAALGNRTGGLEGVVRGGQVQARTLRATEDPVTGFALDVQGRSILRGGMEVGEYQGEDFLQFNHQVRHDWYYNWEYLDRVVARGGANALEVTGEYCYVGYCGSSPGELPKGVSATGGLRTGSELAAGAVDFRAGRDRDFDLRLIQDTPQRLELHSRDGPAELKVVGSVDAGTVKAGSVRTGSVSLSTLGVWTCDATTAGTLRYVAGPSGVQDTMQACLKSAANTYSWKTMVSG